MPIAAEGPIPAFANIVPEYQRNEATIDLMRHRRHVEHGTMDFLFVALLQWVPPEGYDSFNLGLSPLAGVGEHPGDPAFERALHFVYSRINQFCYFKGCTRSKPSSNPSGRHGTRATRVRLACHRSSPPWSGPMPGMACFAKRSAGGLASPLRGSLKGEDLSGAFLDPSTDAPRKDAPPHDAPRPPRGLLPGGLRDQATSTAHESGSIGVSS